jgi:DNA polymerase-3 subunit gamma/tau
MAGDVSAGKAAAKRVRARPAKVDEPKPSQPPQAPLALYRRYRPATFAEVKGQDHVTEPLRQALRSGRVNHAYLFSGPRGCGKTSSARILARSLNCEEGPTPDPCGKCASCIALAPSGPGSIDVIEIDAASHGGIDDARDLRERAFYSPVAARYKIYIIDEAHMVTGAGFNALLKLVEEPPPHLKFVFATTEPEKVIATIRSRTHHYAFRLAPPAVLRELLEEILAAESVSYEPSVLPVVIRAGAGSFRDSLSVLDQLIAGADESGLRYDRAIALLGYTDDALLDEMAEAFAAGDGAAVFRAIDHVVEAGHDPRRFAMDLLDRLRDLIVLAAVPDAGTSGLLDAPEDQLERMRKQAAGFGQERLVRAAETISAGLVEMRGATSPRLLLELMCAQVLLPAAPAAAAPGAPGRGGLETADLAARLDRLERRIASGTGQAGPASHGRGGDVPVAARPVPPRAESAPPARRPAAPDPEPRPEPARETRSAGVDAATLRGRWPEVLETVREVRKVAWILLSNAVVESVDGNVLTLGFDTEGNAKGFGNSGSDSYLADVLGTMFGHRLIVKATVRSGGQGSGTDNTAGAGNSGPAGPASYGAGPRSDDGRLRGPNRTDGQDDQAHAQDVRAGGQGSAHPGTGSAPGRGGPGGGGAGGSPADGRGTAGRATDGRSAEGRTAARDSSAGHRGAPSDVQRAGRGVGAAVRDDPRLTTDDTADGASDLTGTDLVLRELGGQVIDEIGEA